MIARPFLLALGLTALAHPASAFGAMDCVGRELYLHDSCTPSFVVCTPTFDCPAETATITDGDRSTELRLTANNTNAEGLSSELTYLGPDRSGVILELSNGDITMIFFPGEGATEIASCSAREAA